MNTQDKDLRVTLRILHLLADHGVLYQVIGADGRVRWKAVKGAKLKMSVLMKALQTKNGAR